MCAEHLSARWVQMVPWLNLRSAGHGPGSLSAAGEPCLCKKKIKSLRGLIIAGALRFSLASRGSQDSRSSNYHACRCWRAKGDLGKSSPRWLGAEGSKEGPLMVAYLLLRLTGSGSGKEGHQRQFLILLARA